MMISRLNKKTLISLLQNVESFIDPKINFEQYTIDATSAADVVYFAGVENDDIKDKIIVDFGSGTGRLSIASAFLNPKLVLSCDIDLDAIKVLRKNAKNLNLHSLIHPICVDIRKLAIYITDFIGNVPITTIMNPPFGVQKEKADREFLTNAFKISDIVYSIHLAGEKIYNFIRKFIRKYNWDIDYMFPYYLELEKSYPFHFMKTKKVYVNIFRFIKKVDY